MKRDLSEILYQWKKDRNSRPLLVRGARQVEKISLFTGKRVESGKTLLFFDEVQDCASAIMALRYFYEEMPLLHIIAAGSVD